MADIAFLPVPIAVAPAPAGPAATIAVDEADLFANVLAGVAETAPAAPTTPVPPVAAVPVALPVAPSSAGMDDVDLPVAADVADDDRKDALPGTSALGGITAMLALVPPPLPPLADRALPAPVVVDEQGAHGDPSAAPLPSSGAPVAGTARHTPMRADAPLPKSDPRLAAAAVIRALQESAAPGLVAASLPADPAPATTGPSGIEAAPIAAAAITNDPAAAHGRAAAAPGAAAPAQAEPAAADRPRPARRVALASAASDPLAAPATRPDICAVADPTAAALADDPVARQLSVTRDGQWLDTLARDIAAIGGQNGQLRFRLNPDHLGALTVAIAQGADGASVRLTASTEQARTILADAQPRLVAEARAQGLHLRETTVETGVSTSAGTSGGQSGGARGGDQNGLAAQQQQQGRRQPAPEPARAPRPPATRATAPAQAAADLYA